MLFNFVFLCLTENWLAFSTPCDDLFVNGYNIYQNDLMNEVGFTARHCGVKKAAKKQFKTNLLNDPENEVDFLVVQITPNNLRINIAGA